MRLVFVALLVVYSATRDAEGLTCHQCQGDPEECEKTAAVQRCQSFPGDRDSDQICASYYYWDNGIPRVNKGCKARRSCRDDESQTSNRCGRHDGIDKPCRCCCEKDNCNSLRKGCVVHSTCKKPSGPENGVISCGDQRYLGSRCNVTCNSGFELVGAPVTRCILDKKTGKLRWSNVGQLCIHPVRCPLLLPPTSGSMSCKNVRRYKDRLWEFNLLGSKCDFKCGLGFRLIGSKSSRCKINSRWSQEAPLCLPRRCSKYPPKRNRRDVCTNGNDLGSICTFRCAKGYKLIGSNVTLCNGDPRNSDNQQWSRDPPYCAVIKCEPPQSAPTNGNVICTNGNFENSVCNYTCKFGYDINGITQKYVTTTCRDDGDENSTGKWTNSAATCSPVRCHPRFRRIKNGKVECTNENFVESECSFSCNYGYDLDDTKFSKVVSYCHDTGNGGNTGVWSIIPPPTCSPITCQPRHTNPVNGKVVCTKGNSLGSLCTFRCDQFYDLDNTINVTATSECVEGKTNTPGIWTSPAATCSLITCRKLQKPENGGFECTANNSVASRCEFTCDDGYELIGVDRISCENRKRDGDNIAEWSSSEPACERIYCQAQKYDDSKLTLSCDLNSSDERFRIGTKCNYSCLQDGRYLFHRNNLEIQSAECLSTKVWTVDPPDCKPIVCSKLNTPLNGHTPTCTKSNRYLSRCTFRCQNSYKLSHNLALICRSDNDSTSGAFGKWNRLAPTCVKNECDYFGQKKYGRISYTNGLKIGSYAQLECDDGFTNKLHNESICVGADQTHPIPYWSKNKDICCVRCRINRRIKLIGVIDKTAARNTEDWEEIVTWYAYILDFIIKTGYRVNFGVILYDMEVDILNSKPPNIIRQPDQIIHIKDELYSIQYGGEESRTDVAVDYVIENFFAVQSSEEPFVIIFSRGSPLSDIEEQGVRNRNVNILTLRFRDNSGENIQGNGESKNSFAVGNIRDLMEKVTERITIISKERGCDQASKSQSCPE